MMIKKIFPLLLIALLMFAPASFAADDGGELLSRDMWGGVISPEMLGLRLFADLKEQAVKIETAWPTTINVTRVNLLDKHLQQTVLTFSAQLKSEELTGNGYLEMWVHVPGSNGGNFVVRGLDRPLQPNNPWSEFQTSFTLIKDQVPDYVTLNLVINGRGYVWLKDVHLRHNP